MATHDNTFLKGLAIAGGAVLVLFVQSMAQDADNDKQVERLKQSLRNQRLQLENQNIIIREVRQGNKELKCLLLITPERRTLADTRQCDFSEESDERGRTGGDASAGSGNSSSGGQRPPRERPRPEPPSRPKPRPSPPEEEGTVCVELPVVGRECVG